LQIGEFHIYSDQKSLSHLNEQILHTSWKQKVFTKLLGFNYKIIYKKGFANSAAYALSRRPHPINTFEVSTCNAISMVKPKWLEKVIQSYEDDEMTKSTIAKLVVDANDVPNFTYSGGLLRYKTRIWVGADSEFQYQLIAAMHSSTMGGHSDVLVTYRRMK
jgi:hypothetical protein